MGRNTRADGMSAMSKKWLTAYCVLLVSGGLAVAVFLYHPPYEVTRLMQQSVSQAPAWSMHLQGMVGTQPIQGDLVARENGERLLRLSYAPAKLINNQWMVLDREEILPSARADNLGGQITLTRRLRTASEAGQRFTRYYFVVRPEALALFPAVVKAEGEIWFSRRSSRNWVPARADLQAVLQSGDKASFQLAIRYGGLFHPGYPAPSAPRPLSGVLSQLAALAENNKLMPEPLPPLNHETAVSRAFFFDYDRDNLSDALELFYGTDPGNPDSDNDTFADGEEVLRGYNPAGAGALD